MQPQLLEISPLETWDPLGSQAESGVRITLETRPVSSAHPLLREATIPGLSWAPQITHITSLRPNVFFSLK